MENRLKTWSRRLGKLVLAGCAFIGLLEVLVMFLCTTAYPYRMYRWLGTDGYVLNQPPEYIVILGGGGIPSESGLVRSYHGATQAQAFPGAVVIVAMPYEGEFDQSAAYKMKEELILRGVDGERVRIESKGLNTRGQALGVMKMLGPDQADAGILVVTTPAHMKRSLLSFRKAGFRNVAGSAAFPEYVRVDLRQDHDDLGGRTSVVPDVGRNLTLRHLIWTNRGYLGKAAREGVAMVYYWSRDWI